MNGEFELACNWAWALNHRNDLESWAATYAICTTELFGRVLGESRYVYIGSTGMLGGNNDGCRLYAHRHSNQSLYIRQRDLLNRLRRRYGPIVLRWDYYEAKIDAETVETWMLERTVDTFGELPPLNRRL